MISVTGVEISPDLARGMVSISVHPAEYELLTLKGLQAAGKHIRRAVAERIRIRRMPRLEFQLDSSLKKQAAFERDLRGDEADLGLASEETLELPGDGTGSETLTPEVEFLSSSPSSLDPINEEPSA